MFVSDVDGLAGLVNKELVASHVRVSVAHVVVIVLQSSAPLDFVLFAKVVVGFELFTSGMINDWIA